jgi:hypothetical protein
MPVTKKNTKQMRRGIEIKKRSSVNKDASKVKALWKKQ